MLIIKEKKDLVALGAANRIERPFDIKECLVNGEIAKEEGVADGTPMVLFIVVSDKGFTSKKGNHYDKGTYWFSPKN